MMFEKFFPWLNNNLGVVGFFGAVAALIAVIAALYLGSSFHDIRKKYKIRSNEFWKKIKKEVYPDILEQYLKYEEDHRRERAYGYNYNSIQLYSRLNHHDYNYHNKSYRVVHTVYDMGLYSDEKDFCAFLKEKGIVRGYASFVYTTKDSIVSKMEFILSPSTASWNKVEKDYKKSVAYKQDEKLGKTLWRALRSDREYFFSQIEFSKELAEYNKLCNSYELSPSDELRILELEKILFLEETEL